MDFYPIYIVILLSLIMGIYPLCRKELNSFITRKIMKTGDSTTKN
jgi:hypothetical protein